MARFGNHLVHFEARQLSAFTRLGPWAIFICISSAFTRYSAVTLKRPEATCLMALQTGAVFGRYEACPVFASFARVAAAMQLVHGNSHASWASFC